MALALALAVVLALLATLGWLAGTTSGLRFIVARVLPALPVTVEAATVDGRLVGPMRATGVEVHGAGFSGSIARIELDWRPTALLGRTLELLSLRVESPVIALEPRERPPPATGPTGFDPQSLSLPLAVIVSEFRLSDGELSSDGEVLLDELQVELAGRAEGQQLALDRLVVDSSRGGAQGHLRASLAEGSAWDVDLTWRMMLEAQQFAGRSLISGPLDRLEFTQEVSAPLSARAEGVLRGLPGTPAWEIDLEVSPLAAEAAWPEALHGAAARLRLEGGPARSTLDGALEVPALLAGEMAIAGALARDGGAILLEALRLELPDGAQLAADGRFQPDGALAGEFTVRGQDIGWPLDAAERAVAFEQFSLQGSGAGASWRVEAAGRAHREGLPATDLTAVLAWEGERLAVERLALDSAGGELHAVMQGVLQMANGGLDYRFSGDAELEPPNLFPAQLQFAGHGDADGLRLRRLDAQLLDGAAEGEGWLRWSEDPDSEFTLQFDGLNPAIAVPEWSGRLAGALRVHGFPTAEDGLELVLESLEGELNSLPVAGSARLLADAGAVSLDAAAFRIGDASLRASGRLDEEQVSLDASLDTPDLAQLDSRSRGQLTASARVEGARDAPRLELQADGRGLRWQAQRLRMLELEAIIDLSGARRSTLLVEAKGYAAGPGGNPMNIRLEGAGTPAEHQLQMDLDWWRSAERLELALEGGLDGRDWQGVLSQLMLEDAGQELWRLQAPARLRAGTRAAEVDSACMGGILGQLCLTAAWQEGRDWQAEAALEELDLAPVAEWLEAGLSASGTVTGGLSIAGGAEGFRSLDGSLRATEGRLSLAEEETAALLAWQGGVLTLEGDADEARAELSFSLAEEDHAEGRLVAGWNEADPALDGRFVAELGQLQVISEILPELARLEGRLSAQASVTGTLGSPVLGGRFEWRNGAATIPELGLRPEDIELAAELAQAVLRFRASGRSGEGRFQSHGRFDLSAEGVSGRAVLEGENLLMADLPDVRLTASPDLRLHYAGRAIGLGGTVEIPFGRITGTGGPTAVRPSPDEVIVGPRRTAPDETVTVTSRIRVTVGPDVRVQAAGLRGRIEGELLTVTEPQGLAWGRGELRVVDGTFGAFGQQLQIERGRLLYAGGPLENPGLDIRAVRKVDEVTAGALVRGTLKQPEISIYSDPPMPRAEALSYLTLGKGLEELQSGEQTTVNQAASSLALSGGGLIAKDLGRRLGFDDIAVSADAGAEGAALVVSKYLGGGLYVSYGLGLFDTINTLRLRYQINNRLSLEASSGDEAEADLFYTFERD